ncbi:MAG: HAD-IC family P-type ATPase [Candidatus Kuenenbacteria bacterium]
MEQNNWHTLPIQKIFEILKTTKNGLTKEEANKRLKEVGLNKLPEGKKLSTLTIFLNQFKSPLIYILFVAAIIIFLIGDIIDCFVIFAVLFFNAIIGTIQEGKAQNTFLALKKFTETSVTVMRYGEEFIICDTDTVPGDVIILQEGEKIPADARIIFANTLKVDEASLTGESKPITKTNETLLDEHLLMADRKNIVFKGTHVLSGNGVAVVVATGLATEIGKIAQKIATIDMTEIPLKANIRYLSRLIIIIVFIISILLISLGVFSGESLKHMFIMATALSISIIPEGLPIVMTLVLATGVWKMSKQHVLVKRLQAVETLGQTKIIAVDKTGTLTKNEMIIQRMYIDNKIFEITGNGYEPKGEIFLNNELVNPLDYAELLFGGKIAAFCANARLSFLKETNTWKVAGDPTEAAMLVFSEKIGFHHSILEQEMPKIFELPFDYQKKYHATIRTIKNDSTLLFANETSNKINEKKFLTVIGAPEKIFDFCKKVWHKDGIKIFQEEEKEKLELIFHKFAQDGFRVVACAVNPDINQNINQDEMPPLAFVGFFGMKDALRPEVKESVQKVKEANIQLVMITGDHRFTAQAVAKEIGIYQEGDTIFTGEEIDKMSDEELKEKLTNVTVFARVTPEHKFRIIQAYRKRGEIVAMTGDGVNDAPSLVAADLGVAMGKIGTEVAKEAADIVLLDDNFASIVLAIEEGRNIYKTIKKVILYLFSTSAGEVFAIIGAIMLGYPLLILPAQIIWVNFVTDGFLDVSLAMEPKEKGLLRNKFEQPKKWIVDNLMTQRIFFMGIIMGVGTLCLFKKYFEIDLEKALTISFTTLVVFQWFNAWNCRSENKSIFQMNPFSNKFLFGATILVILLQLFAVYNPFMQKILHTTPLNSSEWLMIISVSASIILIEEIRKFFYRRKLIKN